MGRALPLRMAKMRLLAAVLGVVLGDNAAFVIGTGLSKQTTHNLRGEKPS